MKYSILLIAVLLIASVMTFRTRNRFHARVTDCAEMMALDDAYTNASLTCGPQASEEASSSGGDFNELFYACISSELGMSSIQEYDEKFEAAMASCN